MNRESVTCWENPREENPDLVTVYFCARYLGFCGCVEDEVVDDEALT